MIRELRLVMPPWWVLTPLVIAYLLVEGLALLFVSSLGEYPEEILRVGAVLRNFICLVCGAYRAAIFHPVFRPDYRRWLESTPWTNRKPLPLGPPHLLWHDAVVLILLLAFFSLQIDVNPVTVVAVYLAGYLSVIAVALWLTDEWAFAYGIGFGVGLILRLWPYPWLCAPTAVALYGVAYLGLGWSLARFPWDLPWFDDYRRRLRSSEVAYPRALAPMSLGWPFDCLQPNWPKPQEIRRCDALLASLLLGWLCYAVYTLQPDHESQYHFVRFAEFMLAGAVVFGRLVKYCLFYWPPISLWGRVRTGRWIITGYDQVFLAPFGSLFIGLAIPELLYLHNPATLDYFPLFLALALLIAFNMGPSLKVWCLTAPCRLTPSMFYNAQQWVKVG